MKNLKRHIFATIIMFCGTFSVLSLLVLMNSHNQPPKKEKSLSSTSFKIEKPKPKPKKKKIKPKRRKIKRRSPQNKVKPPQLNSLISGIKIGSLNVDKPFTDQGDKLLGKANNKSLVMTGDVVDKLPQPTRRVSPKYPSSAREMGVTGFVSFSLVISAEGEVESSKILESSPPGVFESAATEAIRRWTFKPAIYKGEPQAVKVNQTIRFTLT